MSLVIPPKPVLQYTFTCYLVMVCVLDVVCRDFYISLWCRSLWGLFKNFNFIVEVLIIGQTFVLMYFIGNKVFSILIII